MRRRQRHARMIDAMSLLKYRGYDVTFEGDGVVVDFDAKHVRIGERFTIRRALRMLDAAVRVTAPETAAYRGVGWVWHG